ncbi:DUF6151 family protein [Sphingopyxis sp.]|uniref:DUF6151 family protein n=1 Tax=Sphingopyxis sp. TaxID=1908224 RepID=UPI0026038DFD|nr:DUF6151 family protein [Sphingopyxis sp.]MCW0199738.1 DUF6151 family protein [Sphingopyxis sp.]
MASALPFACECGTVSGTLTIGPEGDHVICHCTDCQNLAHYLGHPRVLDAEGGTALYQTRCARMRLASGRDRLACVHLTDKPTLRWYAGCCRTPLFNTVGTGKLPFITVQLAACDAAARERLLGPPGGHLFVQDAIGDASGLRKMRMATLMRRFAVRAIRDIVSGDRRRAALFDPQTLEPIAVPHRLTSEKRRALRDRSH